MGVATPPGFIAAAIVASDRIRLAPVRVLVVACCAAGALLSSLLILLYILMALAAAPAEEWEVIERLAIPDTDLTVVATAPSDGSPGGLVHIEGTLGPFRRAQSVSKHNLVVACLPVIRPDRSRSVIIESRGGGSGCTTGTWRVTVLEDGWTIMTEVKDDNGNWRPW